MGCFLIVIIGSQEVEPYAEPVLIRLSPRTVRPVPRVTSCTINDIGFSRLIKMRRLARAYGRNGYR